MGDARDTEKAPDAFRTISEVADDLDLPQHVLRFWETRFPQIRPVKRAGGRRFYRPEDVDLLRGIRHLLYTDGFTIKGAQRVLKDQGVRYVQDLGIEREVAVMRSAKPARGEEGEGVTFGGLLGLLPRRRPKGRAGQGDEADLPELPEAAELPLPFPDPEADRDLAHEPDVPPVALRAPAPAARARQGAAERRDPVFEPAPERRREPRFEEPRLQEPRFEGEAPESRAFSPPVRQEPGRQEPARHEPARHEPARDEPSFDAPAFDAARSRHARPAEPRAREPRFEDFSGRDDSPRAEPSGAARDRRRDDPAFRHLDPEHEARDPGEPDDSGLSFDDRHAADRRGPGFPDAGPRLATYADVPEEAPPDTAFRGPRAPERRHRAADDAPPYPAEPHLNAPYAEEASPRAARSRGGFESEAAFSPGAAPWPQEPAERWPQDLRPQDARPQDARSEDLRPEEPRPARRERVEPVLPRRPSRGPASRLESLGSRPGEGPPPGAHGALDDPLLPFFEDTPGAAPAVSEPIEARIQRLRAQERRPARPYDDGHDGSGSDLAGASPPPEAPQGPPEEFLPPRARRQPAQLEAEDADAYPPEGAVPPRPLRREGAERLIRDGEWRQTDWVDASWQDDPFAPPPARGPHAPRPAPRADAADPHSHTLHGRPAAEPHLSADDDPESDMMDQERRRPSVSLPQDEWREPAAGARTAPPQGMHHSAPPAPPSGNARRPVAPAADSYPPEAYPQAPYPQESYARPPRGALPHEPPPPYAPEPQPTHARGFAVPHQTASAPGGDAIEPDARRVWDEGWGENAPQALPRATRVGPLIGPILEEEPALRHEVIPEDEQRRMADRMAGRPVAEPPAQRRAPPWVRSEPAVEPPGPAPRAEPAYAPEPPAQRVPREPLRAGPPDQYLPPHLRAEPRVSGQPPMAAPVLSRDDVHRMQSALYELGECRRLMEGVLAGKDVRPAD